MSFDAGQTTTSQGGKVEVLALTPLTGCRASERNGSRGNKRNPKCTHTDPGTYTEAPSQDTRWCIPLLGGGGLVGNGDPPALRWPASGCSSSARQWHHRRSCPRILLDLAGLPFPLLPLARLRAELSMLSLSSSLSSSQVGFYFFKKRFLSLKYSKMLFYEK